MRRPEVRKGDFDRPISTPDFESKSQLYAAMPRDVLIVVSSMWTKSRVYFRIYVRWCGGSVQTSMKETGGNIGHTLLEINP